MTTLKRYEPVILIGITKGKETLPDNSEPLEELEKLIESAGGLAAAKIIQKRTAFDPAYLIGKGKALEIARMARNLGVQTIIFDEELSPRQQRNLEEIIESKIIDRTRLILDVFARRARTKEGMLQVELAQNSYLLSRLTGRGKELSQQLGGIGARGPGEKALEYDRRKLRAKIQHIKRALSGIKLEREIQRSRRLAEGIAQIAIVGYTNAGKSSLLNRLAVGADHGPRPAYADDRLFATLDPLTKRIYLPSNIPALITDTVGFIRKLPTHLIASFRSTLEEIKWAHLLLIVHDPALSPMEVKSRIETVNEILIGLKVEGYPTLHLFSKADVLKPAQRMRLEEKYPNYEFFSSMTGAGMDNLLNLIEAELLNLWPKTLIKLPLQKGHLLGSIYSSGKVLEFKSGSDGGYEILWQAPQTHIMRIRGALKKDGIRAFPMFKKGPK